MMSRRTLVLTGIFGFFVLGFAVGYVTINNQQHAVSAREDQPVIDDKPPRQVPFSATRVPLTLENDRFLFQLQVLVLNQEGDAIKGARVCLGEDPEQSLSPSHRRETSTDDAGLASFSAASRGSWLLVFHREYAAAMQPVGDISLREGNSAVEMVKTVVVALSKTQEVTVQALDRRGIAIEGVEVQVLGQWGAEASSLVDEADADLVGQVCPGGSTDIHGVVSLPVPRRELTRIVARAEGYVQLEYVPSEIEIASGRIHLTLDAVVLGGIEVPSYPDGTQPESGFVYSCDSFTRDDGLTDGGGMLLSRVSPVLSRALEAKYALGGVVWLAAIETDPRSYPVRKQVFFKVGHLEIGVTLDVVFRRYSEWAPADLARPSMVMRHVDLGNVTVEFTAPADSSEFDSAQLAWRLEPQGHPFNAFEDPRVDPYLSATPDRSYSLRVPLGEYTLKPSVTASLERTLSSIPVRVVAGGDTVVHVPALQAGSFSVVSLDIRSADGRELLEFNYTLRGPIGSYVDFVSPLDTSKRSRLLLGAGGYGIAVRAFGHAPSSTHYFDATPGKDLTVQVVMELDNSGLDQGTMTGFYGYRPR